MTPADIKLNDKTTAIINNRSKVLFTEGTMNASKSFPMGINFLFRIMEASADANIFVLAGKSKSWLERYLADPGSFVSLFPEACTYKGGANAHIEIQTKTGLKRAYLVGYDNKATWGNVLGLNIRGFLIEEINTAHIDFVKQCFGRISRFEDAFIVCNSNGGLDDIPHYLEYLDRCNPHLDFIDDVPATTMELLNNNKRKREDYVYIFCTFRDNPIVTPEIIKEMLQVHPPGSYSHKIYILGERGAAEGSIFGSTLYGTKFRDMQKLKPGIINKIVVGVDTGSGDGDNAQTRFTITGYDSDWRRMFPLGHMKCDKKTEIDIAKDLTNWLQPYVNHFGVEAFDGIYIDDSRKGLIETLKTMIPQIPAAKCKKPPIVDRVALLENMLLNNRVVFMEGTEELVENLKKLLTDGKGGVIDNNKPENDSWDSLAYTFTPHMKKLTVQYLKLAGTY